MHSEEFHSFSGEEEHQSSLLSKHFRAVSPRNTTLPAIQHSLICMEFSSWKEKHYNVIYLELESMEQSHGTRYKIWIDDE